MTSLSQIYPSSKPWDYIANSRERHELDTLNKLRTAISRSKKEFEADKGVLLTANFFDRLIPEKTHIEPVTEAVNILISPQAQQELLRHFNKLLSEPPFQQDPVWLIQQLKLFLLKRIGLSATDGLRQDAIHHGIRFQLYGFYEIYYYFNGINVYIAHIGQDRRPSF